MTGLKHVTTVTPQSGSSREKEILYLPGFPEELRLKRRLTRDNWFCVGIVWSELDDKRLMKFRKRK